MTDLTNNQLDLSDLLDEDLVIGDLAELNAIPHIGTHRMKLNWKAVVVKDKPKFEMTMELLETLSLDGEDADKEFQKPGLKAKQLFEKDGGMSEGRFRAIIEALAPSVGTDKALAILRATDNAEVVVETSKRTGVAKDGGKPPVYLEIKGIQLV